MNVGIISGWARYFKAFARDVKFVFLFLCLLTTSCYNMFFQMLGDYNNIIFIIVWAVWIV